MMAMVKLTAAGEAMDLNKILAMPEKKQGKYFDFSSAAFMEAKPGASGYSPVNLTPGKYAYMCFFPEGGKKNGKPHFLLGMEGTLTVS
jgi:plastocyanin